MDVNNSLDDELQDLQANNTTGNKLLSLNNEFKQPLLAKEGKMTSKLQTMPRSYPKFQLKRNKIVPHVSFLLMFGIIFVGPFFDTWIEPSLMKVQHGQVWASLLRLFGFMVFSWAVTTMILVGIPFVRMQSLVLIFWAIWMHLKS